MSTYTYQVNRVFRYFAQLLRTLVCNVNRYISSYTHLIGFSLTSLSSKETLLCNVDRYLSSYAHLIGFSLTSLSSKELFYVMSIDTYQVIHI